MMPGATGGEYPLVIAGAKFPGCLHMMTEETEVRCLLVMMAGGRDDESLLVMAGGAGEAGGGSLFIMTVPTEGGYLYPKEAGYLLMMAGETRVGCLQEMAVDCPCESSWMQTHDGCSHRRW